MSKQDALPKQDVKRIKELMDRWRREEEKFRILLGETIIPKTPRENRIKDMAVLENVLNYLEGLK